MKDEKNRAVFIDFPASVGSVCLSVEGTSVVGFKPDLDALELLKSLRTQGVRVGAATSLEQLKDSTRDDPLWAPSFKEVVDAKLWRAVSCSCTYFDVLATAAEVALDCCLFVSPDSALRFAASEAGFQVASELSFVPWLLEGDPPLYVRVSGPEPDDLLFAKIAQVSRFALLLAAASERSVYGLATETAIKALRDIELTVETLASAADTAVSDLLLIRDGFDAEFVRGAASQLPYAKETADGLMIVLPGDQSSDDFHPPKGGHGHTLQLAPLGHATRHTSVPPLPWRALTADERKVLQTSVSGFVIREEINPLIGKAPLQIMDSPTIHSRHIASDGNRDAASHIATRLNSILGNARQCPFTHKGQPLTNVDAEIPGESGAQEIVIIGAHLDSIATNAPKDKPNGSLAPGADDDASGVAGVLAAARALKRLVDAAGRKPSRTIRFVLFNAEEKWVKGSWHYAEDLCRRGNSVRAMLQMDMIGYVRSYEAPRQLEVHASGQGDYWDKDPSIIKESRTLANIVLAAAAATELWPVALAGEFFPMPDCDKDPGAWRSDHHNFILHHWPACLVAEDFWHHLCPDPGKESPEDWQKEHPGYHTVEDEDIDPYYAADIARAVAGAAWMIANG